MEHLGKISLLGAFLGKSYSIIIHFSLLFSILYYLLFFRVNLGKDHDMVRKPSTQGMEALVHSLAIYTVWVQKPLRYLPKQSGWARTGAGLEPPRPATPVLPLISTLAKVSQLPWPSVSMSIKRKDKNISFSGLSSKLNAWHVGGAK